MKAEGVVTERIQQLSENEWVAFAVPDEAERCVQELEQCVDDLEETLVAIWGPQIREEM